MAVHGDNAVSLTDFDRTPVGARLRAWVSDPDAALIVTVIADGLLALGAFTLSFDALRELALAAGLRAELVWIWPLVVDGFIVVSTINAVVLSERIPKAAWYPGIALFGFAMVSVAGNGLHAARHADTQVISIPVAAVVSAIPAVALLIISHLIVVLLMARRRGSNTLRGGVPANGVRQHGGSAERSASLAGRAVQGTASAGAEHGPTTASAVVNGARAAARADAGQGLVTWVRGELAAGRAVTGTDVAAFLGMSPATGRRRLHVLREHHPDIAHVLGRHRNGSRPDGTA